MTIETKVVQAYRILRQHILTGRWPEGEPLPGERRLLEELGISRGTLRHALSRLGSDGLIRAVPGHGTYVAHHGNIPLVVLLLHDSHLAYPLGYLFHAIADELRPRIRAAGYQSQTIVGYGRTSAEFNASLSQLASAVLPRTVGALCLTAPLGFRDLCRAHGVPLVGWDHAYGREVEDVGTVRWDVAGMLRRGRELLLERGHTDFTAVLTDPHSRIVADAYPECNDRELHDAAALVDHDPSRLLVLPWTMDYEAAYEQIKQWWKRALKPATLFFLENSVCEAALEAVWELGIAVPEELRILTQSNADTRWRYPLNVTRLEYDVREAMGRAWELLRGVLEGDTCCQQVISILPRLIEGDSLPAVGQPAAGAWSDSCATGEVPLEATAGP